jgi:predicted metal-dependent phosphoesterase TrpH
MTTIATDDHIDLQIHTVYSDGHWQPAALFAYLAHQGFRLVAITDHDTLEHVGELQALGAAHDVHVLPGVEMTTNWHGYSAHLLCYAAAFRDETLATLAQATVAAQLANTRDVYETLTRRGFRFPEESALPIRPIDNARLLLAHGYAATLDDALRMITDAGYRSISAPLGDMVEAAHTSGALAVLAHPGRGGGEIHRYDPPQLVEMLRKIALDGIETRYPTYSDEQVAVYTEFAYKCGLLASAGSDSHGPEQRLPVPYPAAHCAELLERCGVTVA